MDDEYHHDPFWDRHIFALQFLPKLLPLKQASIERQNWPRCCTGCRKLFGDLQNFARVATGASNAQVLTTFGSMKRSRKTCDICDLVLLSLYENNKGRSPENHSSNVKIYIRSSGLLKVYLDGFGRGNLRWYTTSVDRAQQHIISLGLPVLPQWDGKATLALLRGWMADCCNSNIHHQSCHTIDKEKSLSLPTRALDLRSGGKVRLRSFARSGHKQYMTLSHRWGTHQPLRTTVKNLNEHRNGINIHDLPQLFRHAVLVARILGVDWLWIDSLCIIQDDPEDWKNEAGKMGDIYSNSFCTIAATAAKDPAHGFLGLDKVNPPKLVRMPFTDSKSVYMAPMHDAAISDVDNSCLNKRAWVLQERLLSPRIIHFSESQLYWECRSKFRSEELEDVQRMTPLPSERRPWTPDSWFDIVERYTRCEMTFDKDRLFAISGLANYLRERTMQRYVQGLWADKLREGLMWLNAGQYLRKTNTLNVPSWSWASRMGAVQHVRFYGLQEQTEIDLQANHDRLYCSIRKPVVGITIGKRKHSTEAVGSWEITTQRIVHDLSDAATGRDIGWIAFDEGENTSPDLRWILVAKDFLSTNKVMLAVEHAGRSTYRRVGLASITKPDFKWETSDGLFELV